MKHEVLAQKVAAPGGRIMLVSSCAFYLALSAYASATEADASESEPLLDEIVAGSEANFELIDHGRASYEEIVNLDGEHSHTQQFTIQFDYPVLRADMPDRIVIYKPDYVIRYFTRMGPQPEYPPREHRVVIVDPAIASPPQFTRERSILPLASRMPGASSRACAETQTAPSILSIAWTAISRCATRIVAPIFEQSSLSLRSSDTPLRGSRNSP